MKICIFSDIHGNLPAFEAAYPLIMKESADVNLFLGDLCGYYFDEVVVWHRLLEIPRLVALRGNHDEMFLRAADGDVGVLEESSAKFGPAIKLFLKKDHADVVSWIRKLPISWEDPEGVCAAYHGSPWKALDEYVYPTDSLERFEQFSQRVIILGHTHYPMDRKAGSVRVINPGSCGQPRNCNEPSYAVFDTKTDKVDFKRINYDVKLFLKDIKGNGESNPYLWKALEKGIK